MLCVAVNGEMHVCTKEKVPKPTNDDVFSKEKPEGPALVLIEFCEKYMEIGTCMLLPAQLKREGFIMRVFSACSWQLREGRELAVQYLRNSLGTGRRCDLWILICSSAERVGCPSR